MEDTKKISSGTQLEWRFMSSLNYFNIRAEYTNININIYIEYKYKYTFAIHHVIDSFDCRIRIKCEFSSDTQLRYEKEETKLLKSFTEMYFLL